MKLASVLKIGRKNYTVYGEGDDWFECTFELSNLSFGNIEKCELCESDNLTLRAREAGKKKHKYVEVYCINCKGAVVFGRMQENPKTFYLRKNDKKKPDWRAFNPKQTDEDLENMLNNDKK